MAVLINGRTAVHKGSGGTLVTQDTCYTGPLQQEITYQNIAKSEDAENTAKGVFINGYPVCHKESYFARSYGSEAGTAGVKSGTIGGKAEFITASPNVFIEGIPAVRQGDLMVSNNRNTPPAPLMQKGVPFGGNKDKINKFPKCALPAVEIDLPEMPAEHIVRLLEGKIAKFTLSLSGSVTLSQPGQCNPLTFDSNGYKISAKQCLGNYFSQFAIFEVNSNGVSIGSEIAGKYWLSYLKFEQPDKYIFGAGPKPISKTYQNWNIEGNLGFELIVEYDQIPRTPIIINLPECLLIGEKISSYIVDLSEDVILLLWVASGS